MNGEHILVTEARKVVVEAGASTMPVEEVRRRLAAKLGMELPAENFRGLLLDAHLETRYVLAAMDMPQVFEPEIVAASHIAHPHSTSSSWGMVRGSR